MCTRKNVHPTEVIVAEIHPFPVPENWKMSPENQWLCQMYFLYLNSPFFRCNSGFGIRNLPRFDSIQKHCGEGKSSKKPSLEDIQFQFRLGDERGRWEDDPILTIYNMYQMRLVQPQKQVLISFLFLWIKNNQQYQHQFSAGAFEWQFFDTSMMWGWQVGFPDEGGEPPPRVQGPSLATKKPCCLDVPGILGKMIRKWPS